MTPTQIRGIRLKLNWSRRQFGNALGCSRGYVAQLERGAAQPGGQILQRLQVFDTLDRPPNPLTDPIT